MRPSIMIALAGGAFLAVAVVSSEPAKAANGWGGSFCLGYREGGVDCSFTSYAQCSASASGIDASCFAAPHPAVELPETPAAGNSIRSRNGSKRSGAR